MKCNKCGEECKDTQAFCLKCGSPIQVVPDFNLIEAELASNIGELMDEMDNEESSENIIDENDDIVVDNIDMDLKLIDIGVTPIDKTKVIGSVKTQSQDSSMVRTIPDSTKITQNHKKKKRKNTVLKGIITIFVISIIIAAIFGFMALASKIYENSKNFEDYYNSAYNYYEDKEGDKALDDAEIALDKSGTPRNKLKTRTLINDIYILNNDTGEDYIENLKQLIELESKEPKHYKALADYYYNQGEFNELSSFVNIINDEAILNVLTDYIVQVPKADKKSGEYSEFFSIKITADEGSTILYTNDSRNPVAYGVEYKEEIKISTEGQTVIKAVAVDENGIQSKIITLTYNVSLDGPEVSDISPKGGAFTEYTKIKITVPESGKVYYTWDGADPTVDSSEYVAPIEMLRGINVLKYITVDKYGKISDIGSESYNLQIPRKISVNDAVDQIKILADGDITINEGENIKVSYETTAIIGNDEYFIILASVEDSDTGKQKAIKIYGINTYTKVVNKNIVEVAGKYTLPGEDE